MLDPKEEAKFMEFKKIGASLGIPPSPEIMIGLQVHDKNGVLVFDDIQRGHSWTRNFWNRMFASGSSCCGDGSSSFGAGYMSSRQVGGTIAASNSNGWVYNINPAFLYTIRVGTGDTAFSINQYALENLIADGSSSGQLSHLSTTRGSLSYAGTTWTQAFSRIMNNNSGGSITVKECGLATTTFVYQFNGSSFSGEVYQERSVLSPEVSVANGAQLTVTYEISMDFSAID